MLHLYTIPPRSEFVIQALDQYRFFINLLTRAFTRSLPDYMINYHELRAVSWIFCELLFQHQMRMLPSLLDVNCWKATAACPMILIVKSGWFPDYFTNCGCFLLFSICSVERRIPHGIMGSVDGTFLKRICFNFWLIFRSCNTVYQFMVFEEYFSLCGDICRLQEP
jgi:hypothetical protein